MLKDVMMPNHRRFKSRTEWEPVGFFSECLCNATQFDLMLGFFSSSAINVLSDGFATFLYKGGSMKLIINDILSDEDRDAIAKGEGDGEIPYFDLNNIEQLQQTLSERDRHFFECLSWLIRNNRLEVKVIAPKGGMGISHTKAGVFGDGLNMVGFDGSCNFSRTALVHNLESLTASCDWDGKVEEAKIDCLVKDFSRVFEGKDDTVEYIKIDDVKTRIVKSFQSKELSTLLDDEKRIIEKDILKDNLPQTIKRYLEKAQDRVDATIEKLKNQEQMKMEKVDVVEPQFPYPSGPREYQRMAFECWKANNQKGLFAMATGTGKTITALNCLLEIYKRNGYYKAIILVPTITLVDQWEVECEKFHFDNVVKVCSKYKTWHDEIGDIRIAEKTSNNKESYIIISTYASFVRSSVFQELSVFPKNKLLLIADEAHNMGGGLMVRQLKNIKYMRRIGLSATPERQYDESGNNKLMEFFGCGEKYTFEYSMRDAIENGALCRYYYYPHVVNLTNEELVKYQELSLQIVRVMGYSDPDSQEMLKRLLLKRKRIIHKAVNKKAVFEKIVQERFEDAGSLKYTLVYVPEGNRPDNDEGDLFDKKDYLEDDEETEHLIDDYTSIVRDVDSHIVVREFTSDSIDREDMLGGFASGDIDVLTSMKCLDEGVDVPRSEFAIFCASTGNPRQFIQRRGRVLRTHKDKHRAIIHDLIVVPEYSYDESCYELERSLVEGELKRVRDFAILSENLNDTDRELEHVLDYYKLSLFK